MASGALSFVLVFMQTPTIELYTLSLHDALPISARQTGAARPGGKARDARRAHHRRRPRAQQPPQQHRRSEEHTSELQSHSDLVCRLLLEKKKTCTIVSRPSLRAAMSANTNSSNH